jgi:GT2 family glycosyltransferase
MILEDLSVVIPTLGRPMLRGCLRALADAPDRPARVVVVDQGRVEALASMAAEFRGCGLDTLYLPSTRTGRSAGVNDGIAEVRTAFFAVTDDDCVPAPDWATTAAAILRMDSRMILTGRVEAPDGEEQLAVTTGREPDLQHRPRLKFDRLSGGNLAMSVEIARRLGPFDEDPCLRTAEDAEFAYRALRAGVPIRYVPELVVTHLAWRGNAERSEQYRSYAVSHGGFYGKYLRRGDAFIALRAGCHWLRSLFRWTTGAIRGDAERAAFWRAYAAGLLPGVIAGWRSRTGRL